LTASPADSVAGRIWNCAHAGQCPQAKSQRRGDQASYAYILAAPWFAPVAERRKCADRAGDERQKQSLRRPDLHRHAAEHGNHSKGPKSIPGHTQENVFDLASAVHAALSDPRSLGKKVLILDETAAYLSFGLAEVLASAGAEVEVVTPHMFAAEDVFRTSEMPFLFGRLAKASVQITSQEMIDRVEGDRAEIRGIWDSRTRAVSGVSTFVIATSRAPNNELYEEIKDLFKGVRHVGDALAPRRTAEVIYEGEKLGREL
jgi:hypothetical protein